MKKKRLRAERYQGTIKMLPCEPVMLLVAVSVADRDWTPAVLRVAENERVPASCEVKVVLAGSTAKGSELLNATVPRYPTARFPKASRAVTVNPPGVPAVWEKGNPETLKKAAAAGLMTIPPCEPVRLLVTVSFTVMDRMPAVLKVAEKVRTPASYGVKVVLVGSVACGSELLKTTVPEYPVTVFAKAS